MDNMSKHYTLKAGSARAPSEYLGLDISQYNVLLGTDEASTIRCWFISARTYVKRAGTEVNRSLAGVNQRLKTKVTTPIPDKYRAELDATPELDNERITYFQGLIGVISWAAELGRIDILVTVSMLSSQLMASR
jgi:hypothetical protein